MTRKRFWSYVATVFATLLIEHGLGLFLWRMSTNYPNGLAKIFTPLYLLTDGIVGAVILAATLIAVAVYELWIKPRTIRAQ